MRAIRRAPEGGKRGGTPIIATTEIIRKDLDVLFPDDCIRIGFEEDSKGIPLKEGQDISRRFIFDGLILKSSIEDSYISVNDHVVEGRSGGQSAATHEPLYRGTTTLTFCVPGSEHELAGVTHVGLSIAVVQEGGTTLAAFDASGHRIASVATVDGDHQFLGLRSNVPIHQVKIIPGADPDYTFDDLVFDVPQTIDAGGSPKHHSLDLATGERIVCREFEIAGDEVSARPAARFAREITFSTDELVQLRTPTEGHDEGLPEGDERFWMMLDDGSTLLARVLDEQVPVAILDEASLVSHDPAAIWRESDELIPLPPDARLEAGQIATIVSKSPSFLAEPNFDPEMFTAVDDDSTVEYYYKRLPTVWLKNPNPQALERALGFVRLNTGERIVLGEGTSFQLESYDPQTVTLIRGTDRLEIPLDTVTTLRFPKK